MPYIVTGNAQELTLAFAQDSMIGRQAHVAGDLGASSAKEALLQINFSEINLKQLGTKNPALDLLVKYNLSLSLAMLKNCLSESSTLRLELINCVLTDDEQLNKILLKLVIVFYEEKILEQNRTLLKNLTFIRKLNHLALDEMQMNILVFMFRKNYGTELILQILSDAAYYEAVNVLIQLGLTQDIDKLFNDPTKLTELKYIYNLHDKECKKLCCIFWLKGQLTSKGYKDIEEATKKYWFLATTLIALYQTNEYTIDDIECFALDAKQHLKKSIAYHYAAELKSNYLTQEDLEKLHLEELEQAINALDVLKKAGIVKLKSYHLLLKKSHQGQALRLLVPQLAKINDVSCRKKMIDILYMGIERGIPIQGEAVSAIKDKQQFTLAKDLSERFIFVMHMQNMGFNTAVICLAAQEKSEKARRFRQVILRVEEKCKSVQERLAGSDSKTSNNWQSVQMKYRKSLYNIAYVGLMNPDKDMSEELNELEKEILAIVDPEVRSTLSNVLIILANTVITILTLGIANKIKESRTGNYWFFTQTRSGEEVRALSKEVKACIDLVDAKAGLAVPSI